MTIYRLHCRNTLLLRSVCEWKCAHTQTCSLTMCFLDCLPLPFVKGLPSLSPSAILFASYAHHACPPLLPLVTPQNLSLLSAFSSSLLPLIPWFLSAIGWLPNTSFFFNLLIFPCPPLIPSRPTTTTNGLQASVGQRQVVITSLLLWQLECSKKKSRGVNKEKQNQTEIYSLN